jgi:phage regulator Rha-like protein
MGLAKPNRMERVVASEIEKMIFVVRGQKVMLDSDLAELYEVETGALNRSVRRHIDRFPADFMFELRPEEYESLRCQIGILKKSRGSHRKYPPLVFTEQGVAMLSSVLGSERAVSVNIAVIRTFVKLRQLVLQESLSDRMSKLEKGTDQVFRVVFQRLDTLERITPGLPKKRRKIGIEQDES